MAKFVDFGYQDTPIAGVSSLSFPRGLVNFDADAILESTTSTKNGGRKQNEAITSNITSPMDRQEQFRFAVEEIDDVYSGTRIDPSVKAPSKRGVQILCGIKEVWSVRDTEDLNYRVDLPVGAHIVLRLPSSESVTAAWVQTLLGRLVSGLYDTGSLDVDRLAALMHLAARPTGM